MLSGEKLQKDEWMKIFLKDKFSVEENKDYIVISEPRYPHDFVCVLCENEQILVLQVSFCIRSWMAEFTLPLKYGFTILSLNSVNNEAGML